METIPVIYHQDEGTWWADSPQVPGWTAAADTLAELNQLVIDGVGFALERGDILITHVLETDTIAGRSEVVFDFVSGRVIRPESARSRTAPTIAV